MYCYGLKEFLTYTKYSTENAIAIFVSIFPIFMCLLYMLYIYFVHAIYIHPQI